MRTFFKILTKEELKNYKPPSKKEIMSLLEEGRKNKEAAMKVWGSTPSSSGIYYK